MHTQRFDSWSARTGLVALLVALLILPLVPAQRASAALVAQTDADIANRVAEIRSDDPDILDDFEAENEHWGRLYTGVTSVYLKSGKLHISTDQLEQVVWSRRDGSVTDFYLEVEAEFYEGSQGIEAGVIFRYVDESNFYYFGLDSAGNYVIQRLLDGEWSNVIDWDDSAVIESGSGAVNQLGLLVEDTTISVLINDYVLATIQDDTFSEGHIALSAVTYNIPGVDVAYDNFRLWSLNGAPNALPARVPQRPSGATPTPEAVTTPTDPDAETIRTGEPTYIETFDQEPEGWTPLVADGLEYNTQDGALEIGITSANALGWAALPVAPNNYYLEVDTAFFGDVDEAEFGILFRYQDPQNFYLFAVNNTGYYSLWRLRDNRWEELYAWTQSDVLNAGDGADNLLGLLVQDDTFTFFVNETELTTTQDTLFKGGNVALAAGTFADPNIDVLFDNVTLWSLDPAADTTDRSEGTPVPGVTVEPETEPTPQAVPTTIPTPVPTAEPTPQDEPIPSAGDLMALDEADARIVQILDAPPAIQDDFNRDRGNWSLPTNANSRAYLEDDALQIAVDEPNWYQSSGYMGGEEDAVEFSDFYAEVVTFFTMPQPGGATGIAFRLVDAANYYLFIVDETGTYSLFVQVDGEWTALIDSAPSDVLIPGDDVLNLLGVLAEGDTIALTINGQVLDVVQDASHSSGALGLIAESGDEPGLVVGFDDFMLWALE